MCGRRILLGWLKGRDVMHLVREKLYGKHGMALDYAHDGAYPTALFSLFSQLPLAENEASAFCNASMSTAVRNTPYLVKTAYYVSVL